MKAFIAGILSAKFESPGILFSIMVDKKSENLQRKHQESGRQKNDKLDCHQK